jgi:hypothetical protein
LLPELEEVNRSVADGTPIFNDLNLGGFLIYHAPHLRVFVDDRCTVYGGDFLQTYDHARREDPAQIDRWQHQYGFQYALVATGGGFDRYLAGADGWTAVARTPPATLYRKRTAKSTSVGQAVPDIQLSHDTVRHSLTYSPSCRIQPMNFAVLLRFADEIWAFRCRCGRIVGCNRSRGWSVDANV